MTVTIRPAAAEDAGAVAAIHNQGIEDRIATLDTVPRTPADVAAALAGRGARHPMVVAESDGIVIAWGSLNPFNPRPAYDHVVDFSVYVERGRRGRGVGRQVLAHLVEEARRIGYHKMVLATIARNAIGISMYERQGFTRVGVYHEQGQLDGTWVDVLIMEKIL